MAVLLAVVVTLSGCTTPTPQATKRTIDPDNWQVIREVIGEPQTLDPSSAYDTASGEILENVYETLYTYEYGNPAVLVPQLATAMPTWNAAANQCVITLRQNILFSDGTPFNATAVKASFDRVVLMHDPGGPDWMFGYFAGANTYWDSNMTTNDVNVYKWGPDGIPNTSDDVKAAVYVSGEYEVTLSLDTPYVPFTAILAYSISDIISPTAIAAHPDTPGQTNDWFEENMVGTGPYLLKAWKKTVSVEMTLNTAYWNMVAATGGHKPPTSVLISLVPQASTRLSHLKAGDADMIDYSTSVAANVWDFTNKVSLYPDIINVTTGYSTWSVANFAMNQRVEIYNNTDFRKAMEYAFPYEEYIQNTINGFGMRMRSCIPESMFGWSDVWNYEYNPTKAAQYLVSSGVLVGHDANNPVNMTIAYNQGNLNRQAACLMLKTSIEEISNNTIEVTVYEMAWAQLLDALDAGQLGMWLIGWGPDYADPDDYIVPYYGGDNGYYCARTGWSNQTVLDLIEQASTEPDLATRASLYNQIETIAYNAAVYIHLYEATGFNVKGTWVQGWKSNPMNSGYLYIHLWVDSSAYTF